MSNDEVLEYMKERFDQLDKRFDKIDKVIEPLVEHKTKTEASISMLKYFIAVCLVGMPIIITLINLYLKKE